ncbi:hypothetical protein VP01_10846g1 [Puccinia sorghi]|uniref:Uncharacterized protein n=1 Tax=Puccinia sorghi TaxID=27349 RepID=A0A0L6VT94_9BASI|nr:hypothetical protein VP01_10846g1 [Puccinia sorghi]
MVDGLLYHPNRILVPYNNELKTHILRNHQDSKPVNPGRAKILSLVQHSFN